MSDFDRQLEELDDDAVAWIERGLQLRRTIARMRGPRPVPPAEKAAEPDPPSDVSRRMMVAVIGEETLFREGITTTDGAAQYVMAHAVRRLPRDARFEVSSHWGPCGISYAVTVRSASFPIVLKGKPAPALLLK
jgi:hypothetical protein